MSQAAQTARRVLVTGASSGIGRALAREYLSAGWHLIACGRDKARLATLVDDLPCEPSRFTMLAFDVTEPQQCTEAAESLWQILGGKLDLIILNAGNCEYMDNPHAFDGALFARVIETNLLSIGFCLEAFLPLLAQSGRIALMGSSAALLPLPRAEAYGASKAAVAYLANTLRIHLAPAKMSVSLIEPGFVKTPLTDKNDFPMPGRIDAADAARRIVAGLASGQDCIRFPRRLIWPMRLFSLLPGFVWRAFAAMSMTSGKAPNTSQRHGTHQ